MALKDDRVDQCLRSCGSEFQMCGPKGDRQTDRQTDRQREPERHRETDRQTEKRR